jgi:hypothetical protein
MVYTNGPASPIRKSSYSKHASPVHLRDFWMKVCLARKLFSTGMLAKLVHSNQQAPAYHHSKQVTFIMLSRLACYYIKMNDFVREHQPPAVLICVHSDGQVQASKLHKECNYMHIDA